MVDLTSALPPSARYPLMGFFNPIYSFVRSRMMEGTFPGTASTGTSAVTGLRVSRIYGAMPMQVWSEDGKAWPPNLPDRATEDKAKPYRIRSYHRIVDLDGVRLALAYANPFTTVVPITAQWTNADRGRIETPKTWSETSDVHAVCLVGYNDEARALKFRNNWGEDWGDGGFGYLPYDYWSGFQLDSWIAHGQGEWLSFRPHPPQAAGTVEFAWARHIPGIGFVHGLELWAPDGLTDLGWAFAVNDRYHLNVHELYVRPEYRRQGICRFLVRRLEEGAHRLGVVPRYWLSHVDNGALGPNKLDIAYSLGYRVDESGVTWAAKLIVPRTEAYVARPQSPAFRYGSCAAGCHLATDVIHMARTDDATKVAELKRTHGLSASARILLAQFVKPDDGGERPSAKLPPDIDRTPLWASTAPMSGDQL